MCKEGSVRLSDGEGPNGGRVEVCLYGQWGPVCPTAWDTYDAAVVCGELGFSNIGKE